MGMLAEVRVFSGEEQVSWAAHSRCADVTGVGVPIETK